jgi:hypothetical protein
MKYLIKVTEGCWRLDHRITPEVSAMFSAMVSRLPLGGIEARYLQVVEAVAEGLYKEEQDTRPHSGESTMPKPLNRRWSTQAEERLTEYPLHPVVQEFFDKFVGKYGHGSIKELTGQPAIFWEGISPFTAYLSFDNPLVSGQESSTRAVRHKDWPMCREARTFRPWSDEMKAEYEERISKAMTLVDAEDHRVFMHLAEIAGGESLPHPELEALHKDWLEVFEAEVEAWKVELRRDCVICDGSKYVDTGELPIQLTECDACEGTGKKYPFIKDPQAFRPALDRARWAIPSTIATACSHTGNLRTMSLCLAWLGWA